MFRKSLGWAGLVIGSLCGQAALAACVAGSGSSPATATCTTLQNQPVTLKLSELGINPGSFTLAYVSQGTLASRVERNGQPMDSPPTTCATNAASASPTDFNSGLIVWRPADGISQSNGLGSPQVTIDYCNNAGLVQSQTLTLTVTDVNDPPQINGNLVVNGSFAVRPTPDDVAKIPGWTLSGNVQYAYGGMAFNSGDKLPDGVGSQSFATTAGEKYTGKLRTTFGGSPDGRLNIRVQFIDDATSNVLFSGTYGQGKEAAFSFTATGANTTVKISDFSTYTLSTDIALSEISVSAPVQARTTLEDTPLQVSALQAFDIGDPDGPSTAIYNHVLTLTVANGTLSMQALPTGLQSWDHTLDGVRATISGSGASLTVTGNPAGMNYVLRSLTYTPNPNYNGQDNLALVLNDQGNVGQGPQGEAAPFPLTTTQNIPITVVPVNDPPVGQDNSATTRLNAPYTFKTTDFSTGFSDPVDNPANAFDGIQIVSLPVKGVLTLAGANVLAGQTLTLADIPNLVWTPPAGESGTPLTTFPFKVRDNGGIDDGGIPLAVNANTMTLNVTPNPNNPPIANPDPYSTDKGVSTPLTPLGNDTDADNDVLHITSINGTPLTPGTAQTIAVPNGVVTVGANGAMVFVPDASYVGTFSFGYAIADGYGGTASSTISIEVKAPPPVPPAVPAVPVPLGGGWVMAMLGAALAAFGAMRLRRARGD